MTTKPASEGRGSIALGIERLVLALCVAIACEAAHADVLPCGSIQVGQRYADDPAAVRYAAETGRVVFAALSLPVGIALAIVGAPVGAATGPLWIHGNQPVAEGAGWGVCPGLWTCGALGGLGYYLFGAPAHGVSRLVGGSADPDAASATEAATRGNAPSSSLPELTPNI